MTYLTTTQDGLAAITATAGETITADLADFIRALEARESSVSIGADGLRDALEDGEVLGQLIKQLGADEDEVQTTVEYLHDLLATPSMTADISHDTVIVRDPAGGVWHPSDDALAEIQQAADPAARAIEIAESEPMRGTWHD